MAYDPLCANCRSAARHAKSDPGSDDILLRRHPHVGPSHLCRPDDRRRLLDVGIGAVASNMWGDPISLPIFLACYFITLALAWVAAVKIAESMKLTT